MAWGLAEFDAERRGYKVGVQDGISQGVEQAKLETARQAIVLKLPLEQIVLLTGLPLETVEELAKEMN